MKNKTVVIGVGQKVQRLDFRNPGTGMASTDKRVNQPHLNSAVDLAAAAIQNALADTGRASAIVHSIDCLAWVRSFSDSLPDSSTMVSPIRGAINPPAALAKKLDLSPNLLIHTPVGGDVPQSLVNEMASRIANEELDLAILTGGEAIANEVFALKNGIDPAWQDDTQVPDNAVYQDRGKGLEKLILPTELINGLWDFLPAAYSLFENAWRMDQSRSMKSHMNSMAGLFARFADVARENPYSMFTEQPDEKSLASAEHLLTSTYSALHCSREKVNQAAAVIICSEDKAKELGIDKDRWIYFCDGADVADRTVLERANFKESASLNAISDYLFSQRDYSLDDVDYFDCYSCFPIVVEMTVQRLALSASDQRPLTVTGGLPFFGGPGNNYSMHAIASMVEKLRAAKANKGKAQIGLVIANGGVLSKHAMGIYSTEMPESSYTGFNNESLNKQVTEQKTVPISTQPNGECYLETWTLDNRPKATYGALVVGRLINSNKRFIARVAREDKQTIQRLSSENNFNNDADCKGWVQSLNGLNTFSIN